MQKEFGVYSLVLGDLMIYFILGLIDVLGGAIIYFSPSIVLFSIMKYFGLFLICKGVWSIISDVIALSE